MSKFVDEVEDFYNKVFGNKFDLKNITKSAPGIVAIVVDIVMLIAEYRVFSVGYSLTQSSLLALGFVAVSSVPFYLGQLAFLYNKANWMQKIISIFMTLMGLAISGYFGFAELLIGTNVNAGNVHVSVNPVDPSTLYLVAVVGVVLLILGGLAYGLVDDVIAQDLKVARIKARADVQSREIAIKKQLLVQLKSLRLEEMGLADEFGSDYEKLENQFHKKDEYSPSRKNNNQPVNQNSDRPRQGVSQPQQFNNNREEQRPQLSKKSGSVFENPQPQVRPFPSRSSQEESSEEIGSDSSNTNFPKPLR